MDNLLLQVFLTFVRFGLLAWGGGQTILGEMQRELVARDWLTSSQFMEAYAIGQMTPGPGTLYVVPMGYQIAGVPGALAAVTGFFLPSGALGFVLILLWSRVRESRWPAAIRSSITPVGVGLVLASVYTIGRAAVADVASLGIACVSAALIWRTPIPTPIVILSAGLLGALFFAH